MKKFTFKIHKSTGRYSSFYPDYCDIKLNGIKVGGIQQTKNIIPNKFSIGFMVVKKEDMENKNPNCEWEWVWLKHKTDTIQEAKEFIIKLSDEIQEQLNLYMGREEKG